MKFYELRPGDHFRYADSEVRCIRVQSGFEWKGWAGLGVYMVDYCRLDTGELMKAMRPESEVVLLTEEEEE